MTDQTDSMMDASVKGASEDVSYAQSPSGAELDTEEAHSDGTPLLDDVLIALQKSLSRVSNLTSKVPESQARAMISGSVAFSIELQVNSRNDTLVLNRDGDIKISMSGQITPDIRSVSEDDKEGSSND